MSAEFVTNAKASYNIAQWSDGYFDINEQGELIAQPHAGEDSHSLRLTDVVKKLHSLGLSLPVLVRFDDILEHRVQSLHQAFANAANTLEYQGQYTPVYPIKVNQQCKVIDTLIASEGVNPGLEAGSKSELLAILGLAQTSTTIVCNGYKDNEFLRLAMLGQKLGHRVYVVVEKLSELGKLLDAAKALRVTPNIGLRVRLNTTASGKWQNTGGEKGKFGLNAYQLLQAITQLKQHDALDRLTLLHCHIGSQVANIRDIQRSMKEVARYYADLTLQGAKLEVVDVGGGLGVDYEGSQSRSSCSMNYSSQEYAHWIMQALINVCEQYQLPHPHIISESGRAMTAHHAVLITNVIDEDSPISSATPEIPAPLPAALEQWQKLQHNLDNQRILEVFHDAQYGYDEAHTAFVQGMLNVTEWALAEQLYLNLCSDIRSRLNPAIRSHQNLLDELNDKLARKVFCNFSLFQSTPDVWGINQRFPIVPLTGLQRPLTERVVLQDITCDSDGVIREYIDQNGIEGSLSIPSYCQGEPIYFGIFMVGAYQEILGDMHNLFGDTHSVHVKLTATGYEIDDVETGNTTEDVLRYVNIDPQRLRQTFATQIAQLQCSPDEQQSIQQELDSSLKGYTYFED
ncbi:biosynthetic arginine decarboxylase [Echinimonas agarilytica]|uniref:Arginine decarboxylase n=1 Tax=Echinimonas agarilytica TaxID=1215918 RepID=A0AA41W3M7_9GAMM|nr:biosynthetic arginine decarboxylase [Echinimonas agarilytica]MCM2678192.1 biosynthetic arginine decarboxylase [Echinimonas agarilytica]